MGREVLRNNLFYHSLMCIPQNGHNSQVYIQLSHVCANRPDSTVLVCNDQFSFQTGIPSTYTCLGPHVEIVPSQTPPSSTCSHACLVDMHVVDVMLRVYHRPWMTIQSSSYAVYNQLLNSNTELSRYNFFFCALYIQCTVDRITKYPPSVQWLALRYNVIIGITLLKSQCAKLTLKQDYQCMWKLQYNPT